MTDDSRGAHEGSHSVFISFSSRDRRTAKLVCKELEKRGLPCWISSRDVTPGENYQAAIARAIKACKVVVLLFTCHANDSEEIKKEISLASRFKAAVIPVRVEDVSMDEAFSYELATRQWIDAFKGWEAALENLAQSAHAYIRLQSGASAADAMERRPINPVRLRELEALSAIRDRATADLKAAASAAHSAAQVGSQDQPSTPSKAAAGPSLAPAIVSAAIPVEGQAKIQAALALHLGPISRLLVGRYAADARSLAELVEKLSAEIPTLEARAAFKRDCGPGIGRARS